LALSLNPSRKISLYIFVFGGTAIVVHEIDFHGDDPAHFPQGGIVDRLASKTALG